MAIINSKVQRIVQMNKIFTMSMSKIMLYKKIKQVPLKRRARGRKMK
jgi:hypothetical protein